MLHLRRTRAGLVVATASLAWAAPATAQQVATAAPAPHTITVVGTGTVKPTPADRDSNASIAAAVEVAENAATPLAIRAGRTRAQNLANLSGMTLGPLLAIAEAAAFPYGPFGPFGESGTFGPNRFCGTIRRPIYVKTKQGKRKRVGFRTRRACRVPAQVSSSLTMTFGASPVS